MAEKKTGSVIYRQTLSPILEILRIAPEDGNVFPDYQAGQYIALSREHCKLTKKNVSDDGVKKYVYDRDEHGHIKRGTVAHSYSIASAPFETAAHGYLEFYVGLEVVVLETPGRLTESLFHVDPSGDNSIAYVDKITGTFTLKERANGMRNVVMVGTGTGVAPFVSMLKQLHHDPSHALSVRFTLFHANRSGSELGYHKDLLAIEAAQRFDFLYVPSVSRPVRHDVTNNRIGKGRANNVLRSVLDMPMKEEEDLLKAQHHGTSAIHAKNVFQRSTQPILPGQHSKKDLLQRMDPHSTVILTCGNPLAMDDIKHIAVKNHYRFEKEDW